jgi:hypothetical protein
MTGRLWGDDWPGIYSHLGQAALARGRSGRLALRPRFVALEAPLCSPGRPRRLWLWLWLESQRAARDAQCHLRQRDKGLTSYAAEPAER